MKLTKIFFIPLIFVIGYLILISYPYFFSKIDRYSSLGFLSLVEESSSEVQKTSNPSKATDSFDSHLIKGERIKGLVKASENNFGILLFRFAKLSAITKDKVIFRIKKEGDSKWYYQYIYGADQFQPDQYFTFGFPPIANSKNKIYDFEIESLAGTYKNGIGLSVKKPQIALVYRYKSSDLKNLGLLSQFIFKKLLFAIDNSIAVMNWQILIVLISPFFFIYYVGENKYKLSKFIKSLRKKSTKALSARILLIFQHMEYNILLTARKINFKYMTFKNYFLSTKFYTVFLNTSMKKRAAIALFVFLFAFTYRFATSLVNQQILFYTGLGSQNDYDQMIRAATCSWNFCSMILTQNLFVGSTILGGFYKLFGFAGGLTAHLYLMIILSSLVSTLPYLLLSRKNWLSIGGIIGSFFLASSDYITQIALNYPPDNGSLFIFSMFFIVYLMTINIGTIRWLLLFGLIGLADGMYKALFLIGDLVALGLFAPVFFFESIGKQWKKVLDKKNFKIILLSITPLLVFVVFYSLWEYIVALKFSAVYFLRGLIETKGSVFVTYTIANETTSKGHLLQAVGSLSLSPFVMVSILGEYFKIKLYLIAPIFLGLLFITFNKANSVRKFLPTFIFSAILIVVLTLLKGDYLGIQDLFRGYNIPGWTDNNYIEIFMFLEIIFLFFLNFGYSALKLSLPIIPYTLMLIVLTQNSPFPRLWVHLAVWTIILFAFLTDFILVKINTKKSIFSSSILNFAILLIFAMILVLPKTTTLIKNLYLGVIFSRQQTTYLKWVNQNLPGNGIVLAGGKSDLIATLNNIKNPVVYSSQWTVGLLIKQNEIPDISPLNFAITQELQNKNNFKKKRYFIVENDIDIWRARMAGVADGVFTADINTKTALHGYDYRLEVYKYNSGLKKGIYELKLREKTLGSL